MHDELKTGKKAFVVAAGFGEASLVLMFENDLN